MFAITKLNTLAMCGSSPIINATTPPGLSEQRESNYSRQTRLQTSANQHQMLAGLEELRQREARLRRNEI